MEFGSQKCKIITSLCLGASLGLSVGSQVIDLGLPLYWVWLGFIAFTIIGSFIAYVLLEKVVLPNLENQPRKHRWLWVAMCLLVGFFLVLTIPMMIYPKPHTLKIVATGEKNPDSHSSEVWLQSIFSGEWAASYHPRSCKGNWETIDSALVSIPDSRPSNLVCTIRTDQDIYVQFGMHDWSGVVRLIFEDQVINEDLYSAQGGTKEIQLQVAHSRIDAAVWLLLFLADGVSIGFFLLAGLLGLAYYPIHSYRLGPTESVRWYWFALPMAGAWMFLLLIFWPGFLSPDVISQFEQIVSGQFNDWHPAFHTFFLWLTTRVWFSPAPPIVVQILALSGLMGWGLSLIGRSGTPRWLTWPLALFFAASPAIGLILLNPWKDSAYGISVVALSLLAFYFIRKEDKKFGIGFWIIFIIASVCVALFRHNGPPVAFGTALFLIFFDRRHRRSFVGVFVLSIVIWLGIRGPLYTAMNVNRNPETGGENLGVYFTAYYLVNSHAKAGTYFTPDESAIFSGIQIDPENGKVNSEQVGKHAGEILDMAVKLSLRNPLLTVRYFLAKFAYILQILQPPRARLGYVEMDIYSNPYGLAIDSPLPFFQRYVKKVAYLSELPQVDWLFWRNAFWMYLLIASGVVACLRMKTWIYIAVILPVLLNAIPLMILTGGHISRYIFATLLLGPLFGVGLLFLRPAPLDQKQSLELPESSTLPDSTGELINW
jgi:hypothetical protein